MYGDKQETLMLIAYSNIDRALTSKKQITFK